MTLVVSLTMNPADGLILRPRDESRELFAIVVTNLGSVFVFTHQWDKAIEQLRLSIDLNPNSWFNHIPWAGRMRKRGAFQVWSSLGHVCAVSVKRKEAQKVIEHLRAMSIHEYVAPYNIAVTYADLGERHEAFAWLKRAYQERSYLLTYLTVDERLDQLHSDPRFPAS